MGLQKLAVLGRLGLILAAAIPAACGTSVSSDTAVSSGPIAVVAGENFWGSVAAELGGTHVHVTSIISNPQIDPHAYEATPQDGRAVATANYVIANGAGYDAWLNKLIDANPREDRSVLSVAELVGRHAGDNPHVWYSPPAVRQAAVRITADLKRLDAADAAYFDQRAVSFQSVGLRQYDDLRRAISSSYPGTAVGSTESIFIDMAADLGLKLISPVGYMRAVAEGAAPTIADKSAFDAQIANREIAVLVINSQNATPDVQAASEAAKARGIPVVAITETLDRPAETFAQWQARQLAEVNRALAEARK